MDEILEIASRLFGVAGAATPLGSERDQNVRIGSNERSFLLKISNSADDRAVIEMQTEGMLHISRTDPTLPVMRPLPTLEGAYYGEAEGGSGMELVRLFTFLPGRTVRGAELDERALVRFGAVAARVGLALKDFSHPAGNYEILWDLKHTPRLRPMLEGVENAGHREEAERVLDRFDERVAPLLPALPEQMIHNDLTLDNVLLDRANDVSGIVDFGDLTYTPAICDLAIALVSLMWERSDPIGAARAGIAGYSSVRPIEPAEADVLADLVGARLAALVLIAHDRVRRYPENSDYISANVGAAWALLEKLDDLSWDEAGRQLADAARTAGSRR